MKRHSGIPKRVAIEKKSVLFPSLAICFDMDQSGLVPASVYRKNLTAQLITKQDLSEYEAQQNPKYQNDLLEKEINQKFFAKADSLVEKTLPYPHIKFSDSQLQVCVV